MELILVKIYMVNVKDVKENYTIQDLSGNISFPLKKCIKKCVIEDEQYNNLIGLLLIQYMLWDFLGKNAKIEILKNSHGKLAVKNRKIDFNISHSNEWVVGTIAEFRIGIDIEDINNIRNNSILRFFSVDETEYCKDAKDICKIWTLKESYLKCIGIGISIPLNSFSVITNEKVHLSIGGERNYSYFFNSRRFEHYYVSICTNVSYNSSIQWIEKTIQELI